MFIEADDQERVAHGRRPEGRAEAGRSAPRPPAARAPSPIRLITKSRIADASARMSGRTRFCVVANTGPSHIARRRGRPECRRRSAGTAGRPRAGTTSQNGTSSDRRDRRHPERPARVARAEPVGEHAAADGRPMAPPTPVMSPSQARSRRRPCDGRGRGTPAPTRRCRTPANECEPPRRAPCDGTRRCAHERAHRGSRSRPASRVTVQARRLAHRQPRRRRRARDPAAPTTKNACAPARSAGPSIRRSRSRRARPRGCPSSRWRARSARRSGGK